MHSSPIQTLFNEVADIAKFDLVNSRSYPMKFKDFQAPALFSSTFKALNLGEKNSSTFKDFQGCMRTLYILILSQSSNTTTSAAGDSQPNCEMLALWGSRRQWMQCHKCEMLGTL